MLTTQSQYLSDQEPALIAKISSDPCPSSNFQDDMCYANKAGAEKEASELDFKKQFLQFHFLTTAPYPRLAAYDRMQFRFPVPLLNSEYSLQSHCFRSLEWPFLSSTGDLNEQGNLKDEACVPQKTGSLGGGVGSCILGVCGPNLVNYLPEAYLTAYKHLTLELCHNDAPSGLNLPQSVKSCQPTVLTALDAKGKIQAHQRWSIKAHQTMIDAWANNDAATNIIEKGCYTCNTVPRPALEPCAWCSARIESSSLLALGTGRCSRYWMPFVQCF